MHRPADEGPVLRESASHQAAIARREGITRARVTLVMGMLRLAPDIQQHILAVPEMICRPPITERALRFIAQLEDHDERREAFWGLLDFDVADR